MQTLLTLNGFRFELTSSDDYAIVREGKRLGTLDRHTVSVPGVPRLILEQALARLF